MLRNAHERERNLNKEVQEWRDNFTKKEAEEIKIETENKELKSKFEILKNKFEKSFKEDPVISNTKDIQIKELENQISTCKNQLELAN